MSRDAVVELMAQACADQINTKDFGWEAMTDFGKDTYRGHAKGVLSALSNAGLGIVQTGPKPSRYFEMFPSEREE